MNARNQPENNTQAKAQGFFQSTLPSYLRELVTGSARKDILAAIRRASPEAWSISDDGKEIKLVTGPTEVTFIATNKGSPAISAVTPHGPFSAPPQDGISKSIMRRVDRRLEGYALALLKTAKQELALLCEETARNTPHDWQHPNRDGFTLSTLAMSAQSYECPIGEGLTARVKYEAIGGEVSEEMAFNSFCRHQREVEIYCEAQRTYNSQISSSSLFFAAPTYSSPPQFSAYVSGPPLERGPFQFNTIHVDIYDKKLSRISSALGLSERVIYGCEVDAKKDSDLRKVWKQASGT
jgi:hypothetical protein